MRLKLICCNVFQREAALCLATSPHIIDVTFTELGEHSRPELLRARLQQEIDAAEQSPKSYDAVLLLFGLCGNAGVEVQARSIPLVIPRAHDCCSILLGSKQRFQELFSHRPSTPFSSAGYIERGDYYLRTNDDGTMTMGFGDGYAELVAKYGEEDAKYVWETMYSNRVEETPTAVFIDTPELAHLGYAEQFRQHAETDGKTCEIYEGNLQIIHKLVNGDWNEEEFLTVPPGHKIMGVYDWVEIVRAEGVGEEG